MVMKNIYESWVFKLMIRTKGIGGIMLFGFPHFKKKKEDVPDSMIRHEEIHRNQWVGCFIIGWLLDLILVILAGFEILSEVWVIIGSLLPFLLYYIWYGIEFLIRLIKYQNYDEAYYNIGFEKEAYIHQNTIRNSLPFSELNKIWKCFNWFKYITDKNYFWDRRNI